MIRPILAILLTTLALSSCAIRPTSLKSNGLKAGSSKVNYSYKPDPIEQEVLERVNHVRSQGAKCGSKYYPPVENLRINEWLTMAAMKQARDMATANFFSHAGINGNTAGDRITAMGYSWTISGENIAWGQKTPKQVVESWIKSPGHCQNIMNAKFQDMGIAQARAKNKIYWVQTFGAQ
jgi:uncharacterized protein YkwD